MSDSSVSVYDLLAANVIDGGYGGATGSRTASRTGKNQKEESVTTITRIVTSNRDQGVPPLTALVESWVITLKFRPGEGSRYNITSRPSPRKCDDIRV